MTGKTDSINKIKSLLISQGIGHRQHASTIAEILGQHYISAKQKLDGNRNFSNDQIKKIFDHFNKTPEVMDNAKWNAVTYQNGIPSRCKISLGKRITEGEIFAFFAIKYGNIWMVNNNIEGSEIYRNDYYHVEPINILSPPRVAILDNDQAVTDFAEMFLANIGIIGEKFTTPEKLIDSINKNIYDAYILDWVLDESKDAEIVIHHIRHTKKYNAPIIILTGELMTDATRESKISHAIMEYNVSIMEKPAKPKIISAVLESHLFFKKNI